MRGRSRRQFLQGSLVLAGSALLSGCGLLPPRPPRVARVPRIGYFSANSQLDQPAFWLDALREGLHEAGYVEGQTITIDERWADGRNERLPDLAAELVRENVDVIVTTTSGATQAAQRATSTIPIVMTGVGDPVELGVVTSLARPGGNLTGLTNVAPEVTPKRLQLLQECVRGLARVGVLYQAEGPGRIRAFQEAEGAARTLGLQVLPLVVRVGDDLAAALDGAVGEGVEALIVLGGTAVRAQRGATVVGLAAQHRLPVMYDSAVFTEAGGLMFYAANAADQYRRAASYVDRILRGAQPADLPIERPTRFDFVINLQAARIIGLTIPPSVLQQATEVIQ